MIVTMAPLVLLYELSIGLAYVFRPRGATITSRWGEWWEEGHCDEAGDEPDPASGAGDEPARVS